MHHTPHHFPPGARGFPPRALMAVRPPMQQQQRPGMMYRMAPPRGYAQMPPPRGYAAPLPPPQHHQAHLPQQRHQLRSAPLGARCVSHARWTVACRFCVRVHKKLHLPVVALHTSLFFMHRFFEYHPNATHDVYMVAVASIFLAAKAEDALKHAADVVLVAHREFHRAESQPKRLRTASKEFETIRLELLLCVLLAFHPHRSLRSLPPLLPTRTPGSCALAFGVTPARLSHERVRRHCFSPHSPPDCSSAPHTHAPFSCFPNTPTGASHSATSAFCSKRLGST